MEVSYNPIRVQRSIQVTEVLSVYRFESLKIGVPYDEQYPFWQVTFLLSGEGIYTTLGTDYPFRTGEVVFRKAGRVSRITLSSAQPIRLAIISFTCDSTALDSLPAAPVKLYGEERTTLLDLIHTGVRICEPVRADSPMRGFVLKPDTPEAVLEFVGVSLERFLLMVRCRMEGIALLTDETEKSNRHTGLSETADAVRRYLEERVREHIRIDALAREFGLSQTALMKLYKREFGLSVLEDFTRMKMHYAKRQIVRSGLNFTQIADELGYSSVGYFSRVFHAHEGVTPTEYSRMASKRS